MARLTYPLHSLEGNVQHIPSAASLQCIPLDFHQELSAGEQLIRNSGTYVKQAGWEQQGRQAAEGAAQSFLGAGCRRLCVPMEIRQGRFSVLSTALSTIALCCWHGLAGTAAKQIINREQMAGGWEL